MSYAEKILNRVLEEVKKMTVEEYEVLYKQSEDKMVQIIRCTGCGSDKIRITLTTERLADQCSHCGNMEVTEWSFWFCSMECLAEWQKKYSNTIPCRDCYETGWFAGFEVNGMCPTCAGKKTIAMPK